jgi:hypothetical protein
VGESDAGRNAPATRKRKTRVAHSATKSWLSLELTKAAHAVSSSVIALYSSTPPPPKACSASHRAPIQPKRSRCHRCTWPSRTALVVALRGIPSDSASSTSIISNTITGPCPDPREKQFRAACDEGAMPRIQPLRRRRRANVIWTVVVTVVALSPLAFWVRRARRVWCRVSVPLSVFAGMAK